MTKRILSVLVALLMCCTLFGGCSLSDIFGGKEEEKPEKVRITVDSNPSPTLYVGNTYKLLYTCSEEVTITCTGKFNYKTHVFTATKTGKFEIKLSAGKDETYNQETVNITVIDFGDTAALEELIASTSSLIADDYVNFDTLEKEIEDCEALIEKGVTQEEVDSAYASLQRVINGLSPKTFGTKKAKVTESSIVFDGKNYYKSYYTNFTEISEKIKTINADGTVKLFSEYTNKITTELKKLIGIDGKELAAMNFERGTLMAEKVFDSYYVERSALKGGNVVNDVLDGNGNHIKNTGTGNVETDFWTLTSFFALMVRLDDVTEKSYKAEVDKIIDAMAYHRGTRNDNNVGENGAPREFHVYGVHRSNIKNHMNVVGYLGRESVFDDQIWAAQEFLNAYHMYKDKSYLDTAIELTEYIYLVGRSDIGGIYWGQGYTSRHACSSAPFVKLAVMLYETTGEKKYLDWAKDVYDWTYNTLRDPSDNLYYDLIGTRFEKESPVPDTDKNWQNPKYIEGNRIIGDGAIDKKKYSYNSGSMISGAIALYRVTGEKRYLNEAKATAKSARKYFGKEVDGFVLYPGSDGGTTYSWFDLILFKGYFDLYEVDKTAESYLDDVQKLYDYNYSNYYKDGFMPTSGLAGWTDGRNSYNYRVLMDHATNAEVMLLLGQFKNIK